MATTRPSDASAALFTLVAPAQPRGDVRVLDIAELIDRAQEARRTRGGRGWRAGRVYLADLPADIRTPSRRSRLSPASAFHRPRRLQAGSVVAIAMAMAFAARTAAPRDSRGWSGTGDHPDNAHA